MNRREFIAFSTSAIAINMIACAKGQQEQGDGGIENTKSGNLTKHQFPLIEVSGNSFEMGYQHGAQTPDLIEKYLLLIERTTGKSRDVLCRNAAAYRPLLEKFSPVFVEEINGLAKGANITFEEGIVCQLRGSAAIGPDNEACTSFAMTGAATKGGNTFAGQNQDMGPDMSDVGIVLWLKPNDGRPRIVNFTFAGQLGYHGMNSLGVSEFANAVSGGKPGNQNLVKGIAINHYPIKRRMLESKNVHECIQIYKNNPVNSSANAIMCDGEGNIADLEVRPDGLIAEFKDEYPNFIGHANHYVTPEFADPSNEDIDSSSVIRHRRIHELVKEYWGTITVDTIKEILSDHQGDPGGICRHGANGSYSITGYIADIKERILHVRRGRGCIGTWMEYNA